MGSTLAPSAVPGAAVLAWPVWPGGPDATAPWVGADGVEALTGLGVDPFTLLEADRCTGAAGQVAAAPVAAGTPLEQVLLVGLGDATPGDLRRAGAALARRVRGRATVATGLAETLDDAGLRAFVEGVVLGSYAFHRHGTADPPDAQRAPVGRVVLCGVGPARAAALARGLATARAGWLARDLGNTPPNEKDPAWFAARAQEVAAATGLAVTVRTQRDLVAEGFGGIVAVGQGSARPPRLVELRYTPPGDGGAPHVVLVGKGITFDSGGLTLKPPAAMAAMKHDMGGAGAVLAAMSALAELGAEVRVTALLALAENLPGASAQRPGDVVRHYGGTTVEMLNPDAEGRLVLADAMAYAVHRLGPDAIVDLATLTGAVSVALGKRTAAVLSDDEALVEALRAAGDAAGERLWRLPLVEDYRSALDSDVADLANIATRTVQGGVITAALFLQRFAGEVPWAHLDISGAAKTDTEWDEVVKGATGFGARLLLHWLETGEPLAGVGRGWDRKD